MQPINLDTLDQLPLSHIASFLPPRDKEVLTKVNHQIRETFGDQWVTEKAQAVFGTIKEFLPIDTMRLLLLSTQKSVKSAVHHNLYQAPKSTLERWKWMLGVENSLDKEVQEFYQTSVRFLENTQSTSIMQLKNKMTAFGHLDETIYDYVARKSEERLRVTTGIIGKIFFGIVGFVFNKIYKKSVVTIKESVVVKSQNTFAEIGQFTEGDQQYKIVSFYPVFHTLDGKGRYFATPRVGIFKSEEPPTYNSLPFKPHFKVRIGRGIVGKEDHLVNVITEDDFRYSSRIVLAEKNKCRLVITEKDLRDSTTEVQGSLDQKLSQIMIELAKQNEEIASVDVTSYKDRHDFLVATWGFKSMHQRGISQDIFHYVTQDISYYITPDKNKFCPFEQNRYGTRFDMSHFKEKNVCNLESRDLNESWSGIIHGKPLLNPGAGIIPEYFGEKPNLEENQN